jgi:hypothetical protein
MPRVAEHRTEKRQRPRPRRRRNRPHRSPVAQKPLPAARLPGTEHPALARRSLVEGALLLGDRAAQRSLRAVIARRPQHPQQPPRRDPPARLLDALADQLPVVVSDPRPLRRRRPPPELPRQLALHGLVIAADQRSDRPIAAQLLVKGDDLPPLPSGLQPQPPAARRCDTPSNVRRTGGDLSGHRWGVCAGCGHESPAHAVIAARRSATSQAETLTTRPRLIFSRCK